MAQKIVLKSRIVTYEDTFRTFEKEDYEQYIRELGDLIYEELDEDDNKFDFYFDCIKETRTFSSTLDYLEMKYNRSFMEMFVTYVVLFLLKWDDVSDIILGSNVMSSVYSNFILYCNQRHILCGNMYDFIREKLFTQCNPHYKNVKESVKKTKEKSMVFFEEQEKEYKRYIKNFENN